MSKKKDLQKANEEVFSAKLFLAKYLKRYLITLLIAVPIIMVINYILSNNIEGFSGVASFFVSLALLLLACFIALIIFTKKDDKIKQNSTKEKERDPFAD